MIAEALALAGGDLVDRLGGPWGEAARAARGQLVGAGHRARPRVLAEARAPVPPGFAGVHPTWIEAALAELPPRARAAVAAGGAGDPVDVWLARRACADLPEMPAMRAVARVDGLADVLALSAAALASWVAAVGRAQLAYAAALARPGTPRDPEQGAARAVIARCRGGDAIVVGARAIAPHLAAVPLAARQLACRLPRTLGLTVLAELRASLAIPLADAPTWRALAAV